MRLTVQQRTSGQIELGIIFGTIAMLALVFARVLPVQEILPPCLFRAVTGIPCPSCGTTRSLVHLAHGDIAGSLILNPLFSLAMIAALFLLFARLTFLPFNRSMITLTHSGREGTLLRAGMAVIFLANWIYLMVSL
jgi:Protein of unknown function (DUF2752)